MTRYYDTVGRISPFTLYVYGSMTFRGNFCCLNMPPNHGSFTKAFLARVNCYHYHASSFNNFTTIWGKISTDLKHSFVINYPGTKIILHNARANLNGCYSFYPYLDICHFLKVTNTRKKFIQNFTNFTQILPK